MSARGLALFGGAFDPPHRTHRRIAAAALEHLPVDELLVLPCGAHPHKGAIVAAAEDRVALCRIAFAGMAGVAVDDREVRVRGVRYTVHTLEEFRTGRGERALFFLIGSDNLPALPTWRDHHRILELCTVVTFPRVGFPVDEALLHGLDFTAEEKAALAANVLPMVPDGVAATAVRAALGRGNGEIPDLDPQVLEAIRARGLYRP